MSTSRNESGNLIDEFEETTHEVLRLFGTNDGFDHSDGRSMNEKEAKESIEQVIEQFVEAGRQVELFFLQKRFLTATTKPELMVREEIAEMKRELKRKQELIEKHNFNVVVWKKSLDFQSQRMHQSDFASSDVPYEVDDEESQLLPHQQPDLAQPSDENVSEDAQREGLDALAKFVEKRGEHQRRSRRAIINK